MVAVFKFDDLSWARIVKAWGGVKMDAAERRRLELIARVLLVRRQASKDQHSQSSHRKLVDSTMRIAKFGRMVLDDLSDPFVEQRIGYMAVVRAHGWPGLDDGEVDRQWTLFKSQASKLCQICEAFQKRPRRGSAKIDSDRNHAWVELAKLYERLTGRRASGVTVDPENSKADGPFARLVQAFMGGIPGEKEPTAYQVRGVVKKYYHLIHPKAN